MQKLKQKIYRLLRWSERWTRTDMVYFTKGGFWLSLGQIFGSLAGLVLALIYANFLPKTTFGIYWVVSLVDLRLLDNAHL